MSFYSARNTEIAINGHSIFASNASLSSSSTIATKHDVSTAFGENYSTEGAQKNKLSLSYYLTGVDPIKSCMHGSSVISVNFGGLYLNSGYLSSYSFNSSPNEPVVVNASIDYYEDISGTFLPKRANLEDLPVLTYKDLSFSETGILDGHHMQSLDYQYGMSIVPTYSLQETGESIKVHNVIRGERTISLTADLNNYSFNLPVTGRNCTATIKLADTNNNVKETFHISGRVFENSLTSSVGNINVKKLSIRQNNFGLPPSVTGLGPSSGPIGQVVNVSGENFSNIENVYLTDQATNFTVSSDKVLQFTVPTGALSGPITITAEGGSHSATTGFSVS